MATAASPVSMLTRTVYTNAAGRRVEPGKRGAYPNGTIRTVIQYGFDTAWATRYNQRPSASITCDTHEMRYGWREAGGGYMHAWVAKVAPDLKPIIRWHLSDNSGVPMHYIANALYWWDIATGKLANTTHGPEPVGAFKSTVVYGALSTDAVADPWTWSDRENVQAWLTFRLPALHDAMLADFAAVGITVPV